MTASSRASRNRASRLRVLPGLMLAFILLLTLSVVWALLPARNFVVVSVTSRSATLTDSANPSIGYVEMLSDSPARNLHTLFASAWLQPVSAPDDSQPADPVNSFVPPTSATDDAPLTDLVVTGVLPAAAPLLAAAELSEPLTFTDHGPRVLAVDPDSPLSQLLRPGVFITGITLHELDSGGRPSLTHYPTPNAKRLVDVIALAAGGQRIDLVTTNGRVSVDMTDDGALGLVVSDYRVPATLPELAAPAAAANRAAGLAAALLLYDRLSGEDLLADRSVAAVGGIDSDGAVIEVSRPDLRARALSDDFDVVFVPVSQLAAFADHAPASVADRLVGVSSLADAVSFLAGG